MNKLTIKKISLRNFKGVKSLDFEPDGESISIFGKNKAGKTTVFDGIKWLMSGEDSFGRSNFQIKPTKKNGKTIHKLETSVEALLDFKGEEKTLKKVFTEVYTKKHGSLKKGFTGHTTKHYIDDNVETETSFNKQLNKIIPTERFKILSDPYYFSGTDFKWEDRRKILFELGGIAGNNEVEKLDKTKKTLKAKMAKLNEEVKKIDPAIKERRLDIKKLDPVDFDKKKELNGNLKIEKESLRKTQANEKVSSLNIALNNLESEKIKAKNKHAEKADSEKQKKTGTLVEEILEAVDIKNDLKVKIKKEKNDLKSAQSISDDCSYEIGVLEEDWEGWENKKFEVDKTCPTCTQDLPKVEIDKVIENLKKQKSDALIEIDVQGKTFGEKRKTADCDIKKIEKSFEINKKSLSDQEKIIEEKNNELEKIKNLIAVKEFDSSLFTSKKHTIDKQIEKLNFGSEELEGKIEEQIELIKSELLEITNLESEHEKANDAKSRIKKLEAEEKKISKQYEELEKQLSDIEKTMVEKAELLEGPINEKFKLAKFKLFEFQVNGGVKQMCEVLGDGVKYNYGLNKADTVNVGLDIIATLSEFYGISVPIFVDNAEGVNYLYDINTQVIKLSVSLDKEVCAFNTSELKEVLHELEGEEDRVIKKRLSEINLIESLTYIQR